MVCFWWQTTEQWPTTATTTNVILHVWPILSNLGHFSALPCQCHLPAAVVAAAAVDAVEDAPLKRLNS